jgi:hypothetical protein
MRRLGYGLLLVSVLLWAHAVWAQRPIGRGAGGGGAYTPPTGTGYPHITAGAQDAAAFTPTQVTADLNVFTSALKGLAPASGGGTVNFLRADGAWAPATTVTGTGFVHATGGAYDAAALTYTQATAVLNVFTTALKGLAPASGGGTTNFLRADGTWAAPPGGGGGTPAGADGEIQFNSAGAFGASPNLLYEPGGPFFTFTGNEMFVVGELSVTETLSVNGGTNSVIRLDTGTITANLVPMEIAVTWNNATLSEPALAVTVTDTLSSATALLARFTVGGVSRWRVDKAGLMTTVGVDTTTLKVTGGTLGAGRVLTSDAAGVATWQVAAGGYTPPTGTGFAHITAGVQDAAAKLVDTADVNDNAITLAKLADIATVSFIGRATAGTGDPEALTGTQATSLLNIFTSTLRGLAPPSGGGTTNFLRADGTWAAPPSGGTPGGSDTQVQFNDAGVFGGDAGLVYDKTTDVLTVGAGANALTFSHDGNRNVISATTTTLGLKLAAPHTSSGELRFATGTTDKWTISITGHIAAIANNTYDIGQVGGGGRPRSIYVDTSVVGPTLTASSVVNSPRAALAQGTITADAALLDSSVTWNAAGILGPAWKLNVTDTASDAAALLADLQVGGASKWKVDKTGKVTQAGPLLLPAGTAGAPSLSFSGGTTTGMFMATAGARLALVVGGTEYLRLNPGGNDGISVGPFSVGWGATTEAVDVKLFRDVANTLAQRNGTAAQTFRLYGSFTDASNFHRLNVLYDGTKFRIETDRQGTGSFTPLNITSNDVLRFGGGTASGGTTQWQVSTNGHLLAVTDNTHDFGASGATRPRAGYFGTSLQSPIMTLGATALTSVAGEMGLNLATATESAPGAAGAKLGIRCGTNAGTAKLVMYAGTSATPATVIDNVGTGVTGC